MAGALTPELALSYLHELQPDAEVALGAPGEPRDGRGDVVTIRSGTLEIAVVPGPRALPGLLVHDAERVLDALNR